MNCKEIFSIGKIKNSNGKTYLKLDPKFKKGLIGLQDFSHIQVMWWAGECDNYDCRSRLVENQPYTPSIDRINNPKTPDWCKH